MVRRYLCSFSKKISYFNRKSFGYAVSTSSTSHDILEKVENVQPDLIIMDNWIPEIGGIEATKILKEYPDYRTIPVIFLFSNQ